MPGPGGLIALMSMLEGNNECINCKKLLRNKGKFKGTDEGMTFYCDRWLCLFSLFVKRMYYKVKGI